MLSFIIFRIQDRRIYNIETLHSLVMGAGPIMYGMDKAFLTRKEILNPLLKGS